MRWPRRQRLAPIPDPPSAVRVIPAADAPVPVPEPVIELDELAPWRPPAPGACPDCTADTPCVICRALGAPTRPHEEDTPR